jgi:hypothetical protein
MIKKPDLYLVWTANGRDWTKQICSNRHELNRIIADARKSNCSKIEITIRFNNQK